MPKLEFNPDDYSPEALRLIMRKVEAWKVSPAEAIRRLLDQLAKASGNGKEAA